MHRASRQLPGRTRRTPMVQPVVSQGHDRQPGRRHPVRGPRRPRDRRRRRTPSCLPPGRPRDAPRPRRRRPALPAGADRVGAHRDPGRPPRVRRGLAHVDTALHDEPVRVLRLGARVGRLLRAADRATRLPSAGTLARPPRWSFPGGLPAGRARVGRPRRPDRGPVRPRAGPLGAAAHPPTARRGPRGGGDGVDHRGDGHRRDRVARPGRRRRGQARPRRAHPERALGRRVDRLGRARAHRARRHRRRDPGAGGSVRSRNSCARPEQCRSRRA